MREREREEMREIRERERIFLEFYLLRFVQFEVISVSFEVIEIKNP